MRSRCNHGGSGVFASLSQERTFLSVAVAAFTLETYNFVCVFLRYRVPMVAGASGSSFVEFPQKCCVLFGYGRAAFSRNKIGCYNHY
jgi:hypothetical protein